MSNIKAILDEIAAEPGTNAKLEILKKHKETPFLKEVLYQSTSPKVKFGIKQIPEYEPAQNSSYSLGEAISDLRVLSSREETGNSAREYLKATLEGLNADDANVLERIIQKDIKIGMGRTQINKVYGVKIDEKTGKEKKITFLEKANYMGAVSYELKLVEKIMAAGEALSEIKMDGRYGNGFVRNKGVEFESRKGEDNFMNGAKFLKELAGLGDNLVFNGELTIADMNKDYDVTEKRLAANGIITSLVDISLKREERGEAETMKKIAKFEKEKAKHFEAETITMQWVLDRIIYTVWDVVTIDEHYHGKSKTSRRDRLNQLINILDTHRPENIKLIEYKYVYSVAEAIAHFKEALDRGLEGTILKSLKDGWKDGKPPYQVKMKLAMELDLVIKGFNYGKKGTKNETVYSTINVESSCGKLKARAQGLKEDKMAYFTENGDKYIGKIVAIKCNGITQAKNHEHKSLMYPAFLEVRDDKDTADSLEKCYEIMEAALELAK